MNMEEIIKLKNENEELKNKIKDLENKLKKYTNSTGHQKYYKDHKEIVIEKAKKYMEKIKIENPDKIKEWRHNAYLKRKEKLKLLEN